MRLIWILSVSISAFFNTFCFASSPDTDHSSHEVRDMAALSSIKDFWVAKEISMNDKAPEITVETQRAAHSEAHQQWVAEWPDYNVCYSSAGGQAFLSHTAVNPGQIEHVISIYKALIAQMPPDSTVPCLAHSRCVFLLIPWQPERDSLTSQETMHRRGESYHFHMIEVGNYPYAEVNIRFSLLKGLIESVFRNDHPEILSVFEVFYQGSTPLGACTAVPAEVIQEFASIQGDESTGQFSLDMFSDYLATAHLASTGYFRKAYPLVRRVESIPVRKIRGLVKKIMRASNTGVYSEWPYPTQASTLKHCPHIVRYLTEYFGLQSRAVY
ncbi:hypothetical protein ACWJJH_03225 [Endozoicomonadaceae bacterium StTr2]